MFERWAHCENTTIKGSGHSAVSSRATRGGMVDSVVAEPPQDTGEHAEERHAPACRQPHHLRAEALEGTSVQHLGKEVGDVLGRRH